MYLRSPACAANFTTAIKSGSDYSKNLSTTQKIYVSEKMYHILLFNSTKVYAEFYEDECTTTNME